MAMNAQQKIKLIKYALNTPEKKSEIVAALRKEASSKEAGFLSRILKTKKPATFEGTTEEYIQNMLKGSRPKARNLSQADIKAAYANLMKSVDAFDKEYKEYKRQVASEFKDLLLVQSELDKDTGDWTDAQQKKIEEPWGRLQKANYDEDQFTKALDELKKRAREAQALGREWGTIWL